jgi:hypothetical protein
MNIPLISYLSCALSRLAYYTDAKIFLEKYKAILDISELKSQLDKHDLRINNDIKNMDTINKKLNSIIKQKELQTKSSSHLKLIEISTSNYSSVYICRDDNLNTIFVSFRGTASLKSMLSYSNLRSLSSTKMCKENGDEGLLVGIFKIVGEIFYTIKESVRFLSKGRKYNLVLTGHSLGGACAQIFSFIFIKQQLERFKRLPNIGNKVSCFTFGSPRVMNGFLMDKYTALIEKGNILFRRYITNGDPISMLPYTSKKKSKSYYHPDERDDKLVNIGIACKNAKTRKKLQCTVATKAKKNKTSIKHHGTFLGISYAGAGSGLTDTSKEIKRVKVSHNTVCRIIIGGQGDSFKAVFFNLDDAKFDNINTLSFHLQKLTRRVAIDYRHQDIYITESMFKRLIGDAVEITDEDCNPLQYSRLTPIQHREKNPELYCF